MSIYREEAIEALIEALHRKDFPNQQMIVLDALLSLSGRFTSAGESYIEVWLLKMAGFDQPYNALIKTNLLQKHEKDLNETMVSIYFEYRCLWRYDPLFFSFPLSCCFRSILNLNVHCRKGKRKLHIYGREEWLLSCATTKKVLFSKLWKNASRVIP